MGATNTMVKINDNLNIVVNINLLINCIKYPSIMNSWLIIISIFILYCKIINDDYHF